MTDDEIRPGKIWRLSAMTLDEYQAFTRTTAVYRESIESKALQLSYAILGLNDEAGEAAGKLKKFFRDCPGEEILNVGPRDLEQTQMLDEFRLAIGKKPGDVLYYVAAAADELGLSLDVIMYDNKAKLEDRKARNVIHGSGDNR